MSEFVTWARSGKQFAPAVMAAVCLAALVVAVPLPGTPKPDSLVGAPGEFGGGLGPAGTTGGGSGSASTSGLSGAVGSTDTGAGGSGGSSTGSFTGRGTAVLASTGAPVCSTVTPAAAEQCDAATRRGPD